MCRILHRCLPLLSVTAILTLAAPRLAAEHSLAFQDAQPADPVAPGVSSSVIAQDAIAFQSIASAAVESQVSDWIRLALDADPAAAAEQKWKATLRAAEAANGGRVPGDALLDLVTEAFATADPAVARFIESCRNDATVTAPVYDGLRANPFFAQAVQLYHARWLTQHRFYDEALALLNGLDPEQCVDPASLFFYRAVCRQRLLHDQDARDDLTLLLHNTLDVPDRFRSVAQMMQQELQEQDDDGLPQVARLMSDVQRRLDLGRPDDPTQQQEDQVISLLDKLLDDIEKQQQQQQQGGQGNGGGNQPNPSGTQGAEDSRVQGQKGDGEADPKNLEETGAWGMLDKKQETAARELIRQQFPGNYMDVISRYTRKIAEQKK